MAFVILVWGITFVNTRALLFDFSALEIQVIRFAMAWIALLTVERLTLKVERSAVSSKRPYCGGRGATRPTDELLFAGMGLCGVLVYQLLENCAIYYTNASNVAILVSFGPVVTAVMARMRRGVSGSRREDTAGNFGMFGSGLWIGSAIAIIGVALISFNNAVVFELRPLGDLMALAAMVSWGCYSILIDKANRKGYSQLVVIRKTFGWALVMMIPLCVWGVTDSGYTALDGSFSITLDAAANLMRFAEPMNWVHLGFLGLLASALCFVLWNVACKSLGVVRTTVGLYLTPIVGVIFAAIVLGERVTMMSAVGGCLIIGGVVITNLRRVK